MFSGCPFICVCMLACITVKAVPTSVSSASGLHMVDGFLSTNVKRPSVRLCLVVISALSCF